MAAHIVTFMKEVVYLDYQGKFDEKQVEAFQDALGHAACGNLIDYDDYVILVYTASPSDFVYQIVNMLPKYQQQWVEIGSPKDYEAWMEVIRKQLEEG
jgi:hypothetical protein